MSRLNPYNDIPDYQLPDTTYKVTFLPVGKQIEILPGKIPEGVDGLPGSLLSIALSAGLDLDHSCGGVCACSTCHVILREGMENCNEASEDEEDMLELAPGLEPGSRLACQCIPDGTSDLTVEVPAWNRNLVSESH